jgi:hypothetical protein
MYRLILEKGIRQDLGGAVVVGLQSLCCKGGYSQPGTFVNVTF